jgi:hypothetical protein
MPPLLHGTAPTAGPAQPLSQTVGPVIASPLRFAGMAADRYWEFEDRAVDFGALEAKPADLARLARADEPGRFQLFEIEGVPGLFVPPATPETVSGPSSTSRRRIEEPAPAEPQPGTDSNAELDFLVQTPVPAHWIPFVPMAAGPGTPALRKGTLVDGPGGRPRDGSSHPAR